MIAVYTRNVAHKHARPEETAQRLEVIESYFGGMKLGQVNGETCREYAKWRGTTSARRELEDFRSAVNHYHKEGLVLEKVEITLPEKSMPRERWITRREAAKLLLSAWRYREVQNFRATDRHTRRHVARFLLVGLYTGTRASAILRASFERMPKRAWIDLEAGVFYRQPPRKRKTKKRQPSIPLPGRLLAHLRRWHASGQRHVIEWNGEPVQRIGKAFAAAVAEAKLSPDVTPHTLRHTCATWGMMRGADPWEFSEYLGMSLKMLTDTYGHHHPSKMRETLAVFDRPGGVIKPRAPKKTAAKKAKKTVNAKRKSKKPTKPGGKPKRR